MADFNNFTVPDQHQASRIAAPQPNNPESGQTGFVRIKKACKMTFSRMAFMGRPMMPCSGVPQQQQVKLYDEQQTEQQPSCSGSHPDGSGPAAAAWRW